MSLRYLSVCAGIEAATVAWHPLGWEAAAFSEIEAFPRAVLAHHYPAVPLHGDFTTIRGDEYGAIDLLVGGTPCQDNSVAGKRAGLGGSNGNLTLEFASLARRSRPRWLAWENVPGTFSLNDGADFGRVLGAFAGYASGFSPPADGWRNAGIVPAAGPNGYGLAWRVLDARYFGVPQRRRRIFVVGYLGDWRRAGAVLFERESLQGNPPPRREARKDLALTISARARGGGGLGTDFDCDGGLIASEVCPTLTANGNRTGGDRPPGMQVDTADSLIAYGGNNTSGPIDIATALNAHGGPHGRLDFESETFVAHAFDARQSDVIQYGDKTGPLDTHGNSIAIAFGAKDYGQDAGDTAPTLRSGNAKHSHANGGVMPAVAFGAGHNSGAQATTAVRRLTPREWERLQGFPDDYTLVPFRKKPAADGPRYKSLGNSMAVPVMRWIGQRIDMVERITREAKS